MKNVPLVLEDVVVSIFSVVTVLNAIVEVSVARFASRILFWIQDDFETCSVALLFPLSNSGFRVGNKEDDEVAIVDPTDRVSMVLFVDEYSIAAFVSVVTNFELFIVL